MQANLSRQQIGMDLIEHCARASSGAEPQDRYEIRTVAVDAIADILHALDRYGFGAESVHAMAWRHFVAERDGLDA